MALLASIEFDQRQRFIRSADKLREMLGGSWTMQDTVEEAVKTTKSYSSVRVVFPVSGVLWLHSDDANSLFECLWDLRTRFVNDLRIPCTFSIVERKGKLTPDLTLLEAQARARKDAKTGEIARASAALFVNCLIQPLEFANYWCPEWEIDDQYARRALIGSNSAERHKVGYLTLNRFLKRFQSISDRSRFVYQQKEDVVPYRFEDLAATGSDSYFALIKADGDGMGRLLAHLDWDQLAEALNRNWDPVEYQELARKMAWPVEKDKAKWTPEEAACLFSSRLDEALTAALTGAGDQVIRSSEATFTKFPIVPVVAAGEDFWILCRRDLALNLAVEFGSRYADAAKRERVLNLALEVAGLKKGDAYTEALTLSFGVLFARVSFPFEAQLELAEELLRSAKKLRAQRLHGGIANEPEGCIDFHWLESTARQSIEEARCSGLQYMDGATQYSLLTRPWTLTQAKAVVASAAKYAEIPTGKWHMLDTILRLGSDFSELAWEDWTQHLSNNQRASVENTLASLDCRHAPWNSEPKSSVRATALLEIKEIAEARAIGKD